MMTFLKKYISQLELGNIFQKTLLITFNGKFVCFIG